MQRPVVLLAAARFADQAQRLAGADVEADAVDRVHALDLAREHAALDREVLDEVLDATAAARSCGLSRLTGTQAHACGRAPTSRSGGVAARAVVASRTCSAAAKRQPGGGSSRLGTVPGIASSRTLCSRGACRRAGSSGSGPACRDGAGCANSASTGASSTTLPAYITTTRCADLGDHAHGVGDQHDRHAEARPSSPAAARGSAPGW